MAAPGLHGLAGYFDPAEVFMAQVETVEQDSQLTKTRSLNSWIAYRSFYVRLFKGIQQKHASTLLHGLWYEDPFKAKWAVLAKTYSVIKDKIGKEYAPLAKFLNIACPIMGIIDVQDYFKMLKWTPVYTDGILHIIRVGNPDMATFDPTILHSSLNHVDLMVKVLNTGHFKGILHAQNVHNVNQYLLTAAPTMTLSQANVNFMVNIQANPRGMAAQILGLHPNHLFLEISANNRPREVVPSYVVPVMAEIQQAPVQDPIQMMGPQLWSGNISDLFSAEELELDLAALDEWVMTDLSNPIDLDAVLPVDGYQAAEDDEEPEDEYNFADSF